MSIIRLHNGSNSNPYRSLLHNSQLLPQSILTTNIRREKLQVFGANLHKVTTKRESALNIITPEVQHAIFIRALAIKMTMWFLFIFYFTYGTRRTRGYVRAWSRNVVGLSPFATASQPAK